MASILDRIHLHYQNKRDKKRRETELTEQQKAEIRAKIMDSLVTTERQQALYKLRIQQCVQAARNAQARGDRKGRQLAIQKLKLNYGAYRYMGTMNDVYRTLQTKMDIQEMSTAFAGTVNSLNVINLRADPVDFAALTKKAMAGMEGLDMTGMDDMLAALIGGTADAVTAETAEDPFIERLISGEVSLDEEPEAVGKKLVTEEAPAKAADSDAYMDVLEKLSAALMAE